MPKKQSSDVTEHAIAQAETILGTAFDKYLYDFFKTLITPTHEKNHSDNSLIYVAFVTRRCSCLFYLHLVNHVHYKNTDEEILSFDIPTRYQIMTESALIDTGRRIGKLICEELDLSQLPMIILVDDSISYGRSLNNVLNAFLHEATESIRNTKKDRINMIPAYERLDQFLRRNVSIRIIAEKEQTKLLQGNYQDLLTSTIVLPPDQWNDYSIRLSELVHCADIANTAFVMSVGTNNGSLTIEGWKKLNWNYRGFSENVFYKPVFNRDHCGITAFATIRRIENASRHTYRWIPFLFLPQMSEAEFEKLEAEVFGHLNKVGLIAEDYNELHSRLCDYVSFTTRTSFITTYLSHSLLAEAIPSVLTQPLEDWDDIKIAWTYYEMIQAKIIPATLLSDLHKEENKGALLSYNKIADLLRNINIKYPLVESFQSLHTVTCESEQQEWNSIFEEYLYDLAIVIERSAHTTVTARFRPGDNTLRSLHVKRYRFIRVFFKEFEKYLRETYPDKVETLSTPELFAILLQMMDAGAMAVVSDETEGDNETSHQIRICEQALASIPRRYYIYSDLIQFLQSNKWMRDRQKDSLIRFYLNLLANATGTSGLDQEKQLQNIKHYCEWLEKGFQKTNYWTLGINRHFIIDQNNKKLKKDPSEEDQRNKRKQYNSLFRKMMNDE